MSTIPANETALLIIDLQNDYFADGAFPLWQAEETKDKLVDLIKAAQARGITPIHVQHIANPANGIAPFFNEGTEGVAIHADILAVAPDAPVVIKHFADGFEQTNLESVLAERGIKKLLIAGMMTQNCVTHTAISKAAEKYEVSVVMDASTTVSEMIHLIALNAISNRVGLVPSHELI
ncbi:MAG: cysteine hydrolase [Oceanospirillaceae bacterium]|nr:cysteine hydrolase [Oceanospirillaceae bacterium]